jgi:exo-beta-1,3-glucanase (GH17 family)
LLFIKASGITTYAQNFKDLTAWSGWDTVKAVIAGNEAIFNGYVMAGLLVDYISTVRQPLRDGPGCMGPVSTAETVGILKSHPKLCAAVDFVGVKIQPYFDGQRTAGEAGAFLKSQLQAAEKVCGGKEGYVLELAGYPPASPTTRRSRRPGARRSPYRLTRRTRPATSRTSPTASAGGSRPASSRTLAAPLPCKALYIVQCA